MWQPGGEGNLGGEWTHVCAWLSHSFVHLELSQLCYPAILQYKIKHFLKKRLLLHEQYWLAGTKMVTSLWVSGFIYYVQKWLKSWSVISEILLSTCYQASSVLYIKDKKPNKFVLCPCRTWQFRSIQNTVRWKASVSTVCCDSPKGIS